MRAANSPRTVKALSFKSSQLPPRYETDLFCNMKRNRPPSHRLPYPFSFVNKIPFIVPLHWRILKARIFSYTAELVFRFLRICSESTCWMFTHDSGARYALEGKLKESRALVHCRENENVKIIQLEGLFSSCCSTWTGEKVVRSVACANWITILSLH